MMLKTVRLVLLIGLSWGVPAAAVHAEENWPVIEGTSPQHQILPGWSCPQFLVLPFSGQQLAVCRQTGPQASAELRLLLIDRKKSTSAQLHELVRLRDASRARMHLYSADEPVCGGSPRNCISAVLLLDQRDESSCYGTQVVVLSASTKARVIGFIDEVRGGEEAGACIGPWARIRSAPDGVLIHLPAPIMIAGNDGSLSPLMAPALEYRIPAALPVLQRKVPERR